MRALFILALAFAPACKSLSFKKAKAESRKTASEAPCGGAEGSYHTNPDGSQGGFVANTAYAAPTAYVEASAELCENVMRVYDKAVVYGHAEVKSGEAIEICGHGGAYLKSGKPKSCAIRAEAVMDALRKVAPNCNFDDDCAGPEAARIIEAECEQSQNLNHDSLEACISKLSQMFEKVYAIQILIHEDAIYRKTIRGRLHYWLRGNPDFIYR